MLYATSHEGVIRMEYFDNEACEIGSLGKRTIPLRDCSGIQESVGDKTHPYVFQLQSQLGKHIKQCVIRIRKVLNNMYNYNYTHCIIIITTTIFLGHHKFACDSQPDLEQWVDCIKEALHEDKMKRRQRKTQSLVINRDDVRESISDSSRGASHTNYSNITEGKH